MADKRVANENYTIKCPHFSPMLWDIHMGVCRAKFINTEDTFAF